MRRQRHDRGFTIVELMVAMAIAGILISLIFAVYTKMSTAYRAQGRVTDVIQNLRAGQNHLVRELRMTGNQLPAPDYYPTCPACIATPPMFASRTTANPMSPPAFFDHTVPSLANIGTRGGVKIATTLVLFGHPAGAPIQPIYVTNGGGIEPDQVRFFWADTSVAAKVDETTGFPTNNSILLADPQGTTTVADDTFSTNDLIVVVNSENEPISMDITGSAAVETFDVSATQACLLQVTAVAGNVITVGSANAFNDLNTFLGGGPCGGVRTEHDADILRPVSRADTMVYKFEGRSYRIDPARREIGVLQLNDNGEVLNNTWTDLGVGFTNLQIASRWYEAGRSSANLDAAAEAPVVDLERTWYSGESQEFPDPDGTAARRADWAVMISLALTLESRSYVTVDSAGTSEIDYGPAGDYSAFSDMALLTLPNADLRYADPHVFRYSTVNVDFRNMARGR